MPILSRLARGVVEDLRRFTAVRCRILITPKFPQLLQRLENKISKVMTIQSGSSE